MLDVEGKDLYYVIAKDGLEGWYLYSAEQCSFGKRLLWTPHLKDALIFSSEESIESFKSKDLRNVKSNIHRFLRSKINSTPKN